MKSRWLLLLALGLATLELAAASPVDSKKKLDDISAKDSSADDQVSIL
jgi:hypothetical protein